MNPRAAALLRTPAWLMATALLALAVSTYMWRGLLAPASPRKTIFVTERGRDPADQTIADDLERQSPEVEVDDVALSDVIQYLRDATGAKIVVDWQALEAA